ncbi:Uncharacterised protein [Segatella copri]|nr:Uncharacterised protein [Segatella copri]
MLLPDELDAVVTHALCLAPDRVAVGIAATPVGIGLDAEVAEHIVGSKDIACLYVRNEDGC